MSSRLENFRQIGGFLKDRRISGRLKDLRQIGGGYMADWRSNSGRFENSRRIGSFSADWRIAGRLEDCRQIEDFRQIREWLAV
jgi:hypothetical protein